MNDRHVQGRCPMGCGETLFLGNGGWVTCGFLECPDPTRASDMLESSFALRAVVEAAAGIITPRHGVMSR